MNDEQLMVRAIELARAAGEKGNPPFGSVIVLDGRIVGEGENTVASDLDPTAHAETVAIKNACQALGRLDLSGGAIYASGEPCWMCSAAIRNARLWRVVIGEPSRWKTGGWTSAFPILKADVPSFGPPPDVAIGVLADQVKAMLDEAGWPPPPPKP